MKITCAYCQRTRTNNDTPCLGCGQTEVEGKEHSGLRKFEFFKDGYFIKILQSVQFNDMEIFFFRGEVLVDHLKINYRALMHLREARGVVAGEDDFFLIWEMFEESQKGKFGTVKIYEDDPKYKRIEARIIPWGMDYCQAMIKNGNGRTGNLCRMHGGSVSDAYPRQLGPSGSVSGEEYSQLLYRKKYNSSEWDLITRGVVADG